MEQRLSLVTLGVTDVERSRAFYEALGWRGQTVEETVFFQLGGQALVLWGRDKLAADAGVPDDQGDTGFAGITLAQNVRSPDEVDDIVARAVTAGATVTRSAAPTFYGGYAAYFRDLDGHLWEVAPNPGFTLTDDGSLELPDFGREE
jgi:catechol 2,3-dioxygenase-like lactoylglutathione lyase family enzyme